MKIDSHQHYWRPERSDYGWLTASLGAIHRDFLPDDLHPLLAAAGIDRTILVQAAPTFAETEFLLALAAEEPSIAGVVGWLDFDNPETVRRIPAAARNPLLVGLRPMIHDIPDPDWMLSPAVGAALAAVADAGLVFDALVRPPHLTRLAVLADRHQSLSIVIDHCAKPAIASRQWQPWAADMAALAERPNTVVKLSGLATEAGASWSAADLKPYADHVLKCFGPQRVMWGSDWPVLNLAGDYGAWRSATEALIGGLSASDRAAIEGGTARRIYLSKRGRL
jgi:L-fuconolactonase